MNSYLQNFFSFFTSFEQVLHPASGWADIEADKKKRKNQKPSRTAYSSPESLNMRAAFKKGDKLRRNPAP
jgi:hypothetical protein